jgi:lipoyl-dependent peroxiredoxin
MSNQPAKLEKILYTAVASATAGRDGRILSDDGSLDMAVVPPKALGGSGAPGGTNPEQLFAAGYAACFGSALGVAARMKKAKTGPVKITAKVSIGPVGQGYALSVEMIAEIPELPRAEAQELLEMAHQICPYSNATRGNIDVHLTLA